MNTAYRTPRYTRDSASVFATDKQRGFLNKLLDEAVDLLRQRDGLTHQSEAEDIIDNHVFPMRPDNSTLKSEISQDIDTALDNNKRLRREISDLGQVPAGQIATPQTFVTLGMYQVDGRIYKVLPSRSGNGRHYAQELTGESESGYRFQYAKGAMYRIRLEHRMTEEQAAEWGELTGSCMCCGRLLTDPKSVRAGIGPDCAKRYF